MRLARHIALMLVVAIVTVAALLMPSGARAHEGHAAGHHERATSPVALVSDAASQAEFSVERRVVAVASAEISVTAQAHHACTGSTCAACGHAPSSCCATGLAPAAALAFASPPLAGRAPTPDGPRLSGIEPESQIEPPRPFA